MDDHSYPACLRLGEVALNKGDYRAAIREFDIACDLAASVDERAQAFQWLGITKRKMRDLTGSLHELGQALQLARGNELLSARVQRDLAMTLMERLTPLSGFKFFFDIIVMLEKAKSTFAESSSDYWATVGFIGRAHLLYGDRAEARQAMMRADEGLRSRSALNRTYQLNNLVWLMCVEPFGDRLRDGLRARRLVKQTGQTRRSSAQLAAIVLGGWPLYRFVRQHFGK